jgi:uncharacterized protein
MWRMKVAGRQEEIAILQKVLQKQGSEFVALYGRRRIGKTYLIRQVYEPHIAFECSGLHQRDMQQQLENFWIALVETLPGEKPPLPKTWLQAFSLLRSYITSIHNKKKKVIFLDEIAWFETPRSGFLAALDAFWNQFCSKRNDIVLVICGSAASWIIDKVINNRGGLHNRITTHIQLMPFTLKETGDFLQMQQVRLTTKDIIQLYMTVGGVPYYLKDIQPGQSVPQYLNHLFFGAQAALRSEFDNLYASLFKNSHLHVAVVKALAAKNKGLLRSEIISATGLKSGGGLTVLLNELAACGFINTTAPVNKNKEDVLYRLMDEFTLFYYKFLMKPKAGNHWEQITGTPAYKVWAGIAFENLCFRHPQQIKKALGISGIISSEYSWVHKGSGKEKGAQVDFIIDRSDNCINILEVKFYNDVFEVTKDYAERIRQKVQVFRQHTRTKKNVFVTLLTVYGAEKNKYYLAEVTNQLLAEDLFV